MELFTRKGGFTLNYNTMGQGYPVVLVHTAFENASIFQNLAHALSKTFQVVLLDLRGHGYSDKPRHIKFNEFADDIILLLDYLYIDQAAFIGHEMGATIIAHLSKQYPEYVSSLTMINPTSIEGELPEERLFRKYAHKIRNWNEDKQEKFLDKHRYYKHRKVNKFLKNVEDTNSISTKEETEAVDEVFKQRGIAEVFEYITKPTFIVASAYGERITSLESKEVADLIGNVHFEVYSKSSMYPFEEEQEKFIHDVTPFIKKHMPQH
ncbi:MULTISPECIES: alpha/beta fold hydrolase [Staphylococcus]|jgi:pimeloyl-ACP methyl ester carboxylesterase|uniref:Alpha/beta hydrolase n=2 Tax=Staphylococcus TaxID=1279 RepID=A0A3S7GU11_STAHO|nr:MULTISPECIES: alpha/beta hydrolase [Staphylococcus]EUZ68906.1 alpha/beta hydrolase fold family hydrolase [Staphylococcus sp. M0480]OFK83750.1 alpha/beta hydrolase [Staphylococcus sp. HMSC057A02]OFM61419.1 alpha/beta hydrolase [Staphylococcus sp. HMSC059G05]OFM62074.1 alpha/beta hydrolase [Staphylococcus sp. HMSC062C01]OFM62529.1 alpha/beta hydrolase [Staphylococcus sp. HMSC068D07]OFM78503.1 alpha/beta hydrolase [Staphylococcus sp. HMSC074B09]OFM95081.1 alpha/beta hydrolase [Staphylococcus